MIRYEYDLDVTPGGVPVCVNLSQYDQDFELRFRLYSREGYLDIKSGTTVSIRGTKKDNRGYSAVAVIDGTVVTVAGNVQMTAVAGRQDFELTLLSSEGKELNTANFFLCVERAAMDKDTVKSESVIKEFEGVSEMAERIMDDVKNARESLERVEKNVSTSVSTAESKADAAARSAATAGTKAAEASSSADTALAKAEAASESAAEADGYATEAESYAHGGTGTRTNEDVDNAKYYYEQAKRISQGLDGTLLPMGTVTFSQLESQTKVPGYMYNISDAFTTDSSFKEGAGFRYPSGTNVYRTADDFWDCLAGTSVVSVNGQTGAVTITPESIGAIDDETQIQFQESNTPVNIESGENIPAIFGKIKKMIGSLLIGAGSTLLGQNLTAARALVSDVNGKVGTSTITAAELGYLAGLTKNAQSQFNELNENITVLQTDSGRTNFPFFIDPINLNLVFDLGVWNDRPSWIVAGSISGGKVICMYGGTNASGTLTAISGHDIIRENSAQKETVFANYHNDNRRFLRIRISGAPDVGNRICVIPLCNAKLIQQWVG